MYKILDENLRSCHGGDAQWVVGERVECSGPLVPCQNGIHICRDEDDVLVWLGEVICPVTEHSSDYVDDKNKRVTRWAVIGEPIPYWNDRTARHFACDCAELAMKYVDVSEHEMLQDYIDVLRACADWPEEWEEERMLVNEWAYENLPWWIVIQGASLYRPWVAARYVVVDARYEAWQVLGESERIAERKEVVAIFKSYLDGTNEWVMP